MSTRRSGVTAFIGSWATPFTTVGTRPICAHSVDRRQYERAQRISCAIPKEGTGSLSQNVEGKDAKGKEALGISNEPAEAKTPNNSSEVRSSEAEDLSQVEGAMSLEDFGGFDAGLEAAFSRNKETLEQFSMHLDFSERNRGHGASLGPDEEEEGDDDEWEDAKETAVPGAPDEVDRVAVESDEAVAAINEAKTKSNRGTKKSTKGATQKKKSPKSRKKKTETKMTQMEMLNSLEWSTEPRWFFLQVKPGFEQSCAISIRNMAQSLEALEVKEVLVPVTKIMRLTKGGQSVKKEERIFPGYILVLMVMNQQNYADVQRVPNVQWFMGDPNRDRKTGQPFRPPLPVSDAEMKIVFEKVAEAGSAKPEKKTSIRPGDAIEVLSGPFAGNKGRVLAVKPDLHVISARLMMIGREAPVEFEMDQICVVQDVPEADDSSKERTGSWQAGDAPSTPQSRLNKENANRSVSLFGGPGNTADLASPADDLAALLSDDNFETEDDMSSFFGLESNESSKPKTQGDSGKVGRRETGKRRSSKASANEFEISSIFRDEGDHFSFLDEEQDQHITTKRQDSSQFGKEDSRGDALKSSDVDLTSFLSTNEGSDLWGATDKREPEHLSSLSNDEMRTSGALEDGKDNLFDFLDSDPGEDFEEATVLPEVDG
ncbi:unnamed protein product [Chondrus crispus]|uniref:KOW domain-containing protein n=1 Tax=Chondrus crispus TaxID=2769 RepID=R7QD33_CHOCR|nr:unnamed protein product [Chondrus crispus]CDF35969.1 unnamed protein product [Chondrus crispus]|eukprot:XP_005715788.1 unnamed protein product [Chondrus crispus]